MFEKLLSRKLRTEISFQISYHPRQKSAAQRVRSNWSSNCLFNPLQARYFLCLESNTILLNDTILLNVRYPEAPIYLINTAAGSVITKTSELAKVNVVLISIVTTYFSCFLCANHPEETNTLGSLDVWMAGNFRFFFWIFLNHLLCAKAYFLQCWRLMEHFLISKIILFWENNSYIS